MSNPFTPRRDRPPKPAAPSAPPPAPAETPSPEPEGNTAGAEPTPETTPGATEAPGSGVTRAPLPSHGHLEGMKKADLQELCRTRDVEYTTSDTRDDLIEKLERTR